MEYLQEGLRRLHRHEGTRGQEEEVLLLEIVKVQRMDPDFPDADLPDFSAVPVWVTVTVGSQGPVLITEEKSQSMRLLGCFKDLWLFKAKVIVPRDGKVQVNVMYRCHSSTPDGAFDLEDKILGSAVLSLAQIELGEAHDHALSLGSQQALAPHPEGLRSVGSVTVRVMETKFAPQQQPTTFYSSTYTSTSTTSTSASSKRIDSSVPPLPPPHTFTSLGTLQVIVWQGRAINTAFPCYVVLSSLQPRHLYNHSQRFRTTTVGNPSSPIFDYVAQFDLPNLHGNIVVELWEENPLQNTMLGQVIFPISWLTDRLTLTELMVERSSDEMSLSGWFEVFPTLRAGRYNRGGLYLPHVKGIPQSTGYGLTHPSVSIGFIKLDITLLLNAPVMLTILRDPWSYKPEQEELDDIEEAGISSILVTGHSLLRIFNLLKNPPFVSMFLEILNWRAPFPLCVGVLYTLSYTALLAQPWQYPLMAAIVSILVAWSAGSRTRSQLKHIRLFNNSAISVSRDDTRDVERRHDVAKVATEERLAGETEKSSTSSRMKKKNDGGDDRQATGDIGDAGASPRSKDMGLSEQYKHMKREALNMERSVQATCSKLERYSHMMCFGDPILSGITAMLAVLCALCGSVALFVLSPNQVLFLLILALFTPREMQDFALRSCTERAKRLVFWAIEGPSSTVQAHHQEIDGEKKVSYTRWLKLQAKKWIRMFPDATELQHKHICAMAFISREHENERLPSNRVKVYGGIGGGGGEGGEMTADGAIILEDIAALFQALWKQAIAAAELTCDTPLTGPVPPRIPEESGDDDRARPKLRICPRSVGDVYLEKRASQLASPRWQDGVLEQTISQQRLFEKQQRLLEQRQKEDQVTRGSTSPADSSGWASTRKAIEHFRITMTEGSAGGGGVGLISWLRRTVSPPPMVHSRPTIRNDFKKDFTVRVTVLSVKGLTVKALTKMNTWAASFTQKIVCDLSVMPHSSCGTYFRTGGQPRSPNLVFREEFIFPKVTHRAKAVLVVVSMKSLSPQMHLGHAGGTQSSELHLGHALAPLEAVQQHQLLHPQTPLVSWFPLHNRTGRKISQAAAQLSIELIVK